MSDLINDAYAPPRAEVADIPDSEASVQPVKLFSAKGRIGRVRFLAYYTYSYLLVVMLAGVLVGILSLGLEMAGPENSMFFSALTSVLLIPYAIFTILITIQRSHDMDWSGWMMLLALIPLVGLIWMAKSGTPGPNRFGAPPPPNTLAVKIGAWLLPVLFVGAIIASLAMESSVR